MKPKKDLIQRRREDDFSKENIKDNIRKEILLTKEKERKRFLNEMISKNRYKRKSLSDKISSGLSNENLSFIIQQIKDEKHKHNFINLLFSEEYDKANEILKINNIKSNNKLQIYLKPLLILTENENESVVKIIVSEEKNIYYIINYINNILNKKKELNHDKFLIISNVLISLINQESEALNIIKSKIKIKNIVELFMNLLSIHNFDFLYYYLFYIYTFLSLLNENELDGYTEICFKLIKKYESQKELFKNNLTEIFDIFVIFSQNPKTCQFIIKNLNLFLCNLSSEKELIRNKLSIFNNILINLGENKISLYIEDEPYKSIIDFAILKIQNFDINNNSEILHEEILNSFNILFTIISNDAYPYNNIYDIAYNFYNKTFNLNVRQIKDNNYLIEAININFLLIKTLITKRKSVFLKKLYNGNLYLKIKEQLELLISDDSKVLYENEYIDLIQIIGAIFDYELTLVQNKRTITIKLNDLNFSDILDKIISKTNDEKINEFKNKYYNPFTLEVVRELTKLKFTH